MPLYGRRASKPDPGAQVDWSHPLAQGLGGLWALSEGSGPTLYDATGRLPLALSGGPTWGSGATSGVAFSGSSATATATLPAWLAPQYPITLAAGFRQLAAAGSNAGLIGLTLATPPSPPYAAAGIQLDADGVHGQVGVTDSGNAWTTFDRWPNPAIGSDQVWSVSIGAGVVATYSGGAPIASDAVTLSSSLSYTASAQAFLGAWVGAGGVPGVLIYWGAWWGRVLSAGEHAALAAGPWPLFAPPAYRLFGGMRRFRRTLYDRAGSRGVA